VRQLGHNARVADVAARARYLTGLVRTGSARVGLTVEAFSGAEPEDHIQKVRNGGMGQFFAARPRGDEVS